MISASSRSFLVGGVGLLLLGIVLMLWTGGLIPTPVALWPLGFVILGLLALYRGFVGGGRAGYVLAGMMMAQIGAVVFLTNTVMRPVGLVRVWPLFMTVTGISLFVYACKKPDRSTRISLIIPSVALIILSVIFLLFSLELVTQGFSDFVARWWPGLFVLVGAALIIAWAVQSTTGRSDRESGDESDHQSGNDPLEGIPEDQ